LSFQPGAKTAGEGEAKIGAPHVDVDDAVSFHDRRELSADGLDFWQLRHVRACSAP